MAFWPVGSQEPWLLKRDQSNWEERENGRVSLPGRRLDKTERGWGCDYLTLFRPAFFDFRRTCKKQKTTTKKNRDSRVADISGDDGFRRSAARGPWQCNKNKGGCPPLPPYLLHCIARKFVEHVHIWSKTPGEKRESRLQKKRVAPVVGCERRPESVRPTIRVFQQWR